mmetsp:Transcript_52787/g.150461  ORF Transcript_52787/g.150461 Transcript_52787/m.150461 type:complete len:322 (+) Transcript_52787:102-1067(+)|eukprot:CAMPEP_0168360522 /NCGR_PEP_ID=MMETSP0228-20121227/2205_1 /TAXON_ID=133427 /ORGANISM="Protoceratium reticulatum, Strain CCCM 535 (=CCMP 1889)" /LENGTH=321 /DNA_ID=CAMNT_0008373193 /DNA_START=52 /DNA_END=1017 /DNA_ORIENTATION=-
MATAARLLLIALGRAALLTQGLALSATHKESGIDVARHTATVVKPKAVAPPKANQTAEWIHFPSNPTFGIVTGGTPDLYFAKDNFASKTEAIMLEYARKHGYALFVDRDMGRWSARRKGWNKIKLLQDLLKDVSFLTWMDADIVLLNLSIPLHDLIWNSTCDAVEQSRWQPFLPNAANESTFLWMSEDVTPSRYLVNVNTGVMVVRNNDLGRDFLDRVWKIGDNPLHFEHHEDPWAWTAAGQTNPNYGSPWEQGAVWDVLAEDPERFMRGTCVTPIGTLQSVRSFMWEEGQFSRHLATMSNFARTKVASAALQATKTRPPR